MAQLTIVGDPVAPISSAFLHHDMEYALGRHGTMARAMHMPWACRLWTERTPQVTRANVDVQPYAFTTKSLYVGHMDHK